jgi:transcriptional regulator with XRE-family HTH domain
MTVDIYTGRDRESVGARLRLSRDALGLTQLDFASGAGVRPTAYNQQEGGTKLPGIEAAQALCDAYHLTLDWIYRGDVSGLSYKMASTIHALAVSRGLAH